MMNVYIILIYKFKSLKLILALDTMSALFQNISARSQNLHEHGVCFVLTNQQNLN